MFKMKTAIPISIKHTRPSFVVDTRLIGHRNFGIFSTQMKYVSIVIRMSAVIIKNVFTSRLRPTGIEGFKLGFKMFIGWTTDFFIIHTKTYPLWCICWPYNEL